MYNSANSGLIAGSARDLPPFRLYQPNSVAEAVDLLGQNGPFAVPYAGGTDLCAALREGKRIDALVALNNLSELKEISIRNDELRIGSLVTHFSGSANETVNCIPGLAESWAKIATVRIRFQATIGGNLMARRAGYEMAILLMALDARLHFAYADGERDYSATDIPSPEKCAGGLLTHITIPLSTNPRIHYERSMRPTLTQALGIRTGANGKEHGKLVIAAGYLPPFAIDPDISGSGSAEDIAAQAFEAGALQFKDAAFESGYLQQVGGVFLKRQLIRMGVAS